MKQAITYKNIWRVSWPIILSSTAQNIVNAVDMAFLGRLGDVAVGAAGNSIIFYYVFVVTAMGFAIGGEILVGRNNGEAKYSAVGKILDHCIYFFIPFSIFLFSCLQFGTPSILKAVIASDEIYSVSVDFLEVRAFGIFFALANLVFRIFFVGITDTRILTTSTFFMALVNIILDYLLIFGNAGFPAMGVAGAALASVIAEASTTIYFAIYTRRRKDISQYELFKFQPFESTLFTRLLKIASPTLIQSFLATAAWLIFFLIIEKIGERELAISHIVRSIYMIMIIPLFGFSHATNTLVSNIIGQGDANQILRFVKKAVTLSILSTALFFPFVYIFAGDIISLYTSDQMMINQAIPVLMVVNVAMLFFAAAYIIFSAVSGTGSTIVSLIIESFTLCIYLSGTYYIAIVLNESLPVVWYSEFIYFGVMGPLSWLYLKYGNWKARKI